MRFILVALFLINIRTMFGSPVIDNNYLRTANYERLTKYRSLYESLYYVQKDLRDFWKKTDFVFPKNVKLGERNIIVKYFQTQAKLFKQDDPVLDDFKEVKKILDVYILSRVRNNFSPRQFFMGLQEIMQDPEHCHRLQNYASKNTRWLATEFLFEALIKAEIEGPGNKWYPAAYLDQALERFLSIAIQGQLENCNSFIARVHTHSATISKNAFAFYKNLFDNHSGYLQAAKLLEELRDLNQDGLEFWRLWSHGLGKNSFEKIPDKDRIMYRSIVQGKSIKELFKVQKRKPKHQPSFTLPENVQKQHEVLPNNFDVISDTSTGDPSELLQTTAPGSDKDQEPEEPCEFFLEESEQWWVGYNLERKLKESRLREARKMHEKSANKAIANGEGTYDNLSIVAEVYNEKACVDFILTRYQDIKNYFLLKDILSPSYRKLTNLSWRTDVLPLLYDLGARVDNSLAGSRVQVSLNGKVTVFHTHGVIKKGTINDHLRGFLLSSLLPDN